MDSKIVICGCTETGVETLEFLIEQNITIDYIVSLDEEQAKKYLQIFRKVLMMVQELDYLEKVRRVQKGEEMVIYISLFR